MEQPTFDWHRPVTYFDGETYEPARDGERLEGQLQRVFALMADARWRTLAEIATAVDGSEAAVSARLRDLRKARFGGHTVNRRYLHDGIWQYQVLVRRV